MNATGLTLEGCTIGDWADGGGEEGAAEDLGYNYDTTTKTYTVYNADGLLAWNEAAQKDKSINCTLSADINMAGKEWTPIGTDENNSYNGIFDGNGNTITGADRQSVGKIQCGVVRLSWFRRQGAEPDTRKCKYIWYLLRWQRSGNKLWYRERLHRLWKYHGN